MSVVVVVVVVVVAVVSLFVYVCLLARVGVLCHPRGMVLGHACRILPPAPTVLC